MIYRKMSIHTDMCQYIRYIEDFNDSYTLTSLVQILTNVLGHMLQAEPLVHDIHEEFPLH